VSVWLGVRDTIFMNDIETPTHTI